MMVEYPVVIGEYSRFQVLSIIVDHPKGGSYVLGRRGDLRDHLRKGPKTAEELQKLSGLSKKNLYRGLQKMEAHGEVQVFPVRLGHRWTSLYCLPPHLEAAVSISGFRPEGSPTRGVEGRIAEALQTLREKLLRHPEVEEALLHAGLSPEDAGLRQAVYRVGGPLGWTPPTIEERRKAAEERARLTRVAMWLREGKLTPEMERALPKGEVERARAYTEKFPDTQTPKVTK